LLTLLLLTAASTLRAQTVPPALMVKEGERSQPLGISRVDTQVRIFGRVAETTTTMTFTNPHDRVLQGDLYFPLPEGATISGYALDIAGKMVDGVAVEKHKAREVFEKIVRQSLDPGLVEWTRGNNFKTRVFPIPAKGSRTIRLSYVTELIGGDQTPAYHLPLKYRRPIGQFSLRVEVVKPAAAPVVRQGDLTNFGFSRWQDSFVAEATLEDFTPKEDLLIALPNVEKQSVLVERGDDGQCYFVIHDLHVPLPRIEPPPMPVRPKHVVVFWDASSSRGASDHQRETELLRTCFEDFLPSDVKSAGFTIDLVLLRNVAETPRRFDSANLNWRDPRKNDALFDALANVQYDGGTQLGALAPVPGGKKPDFYLLFSDGLSNFGRQQPGKLDAPVYAFSADATADHAFLRHLAMTTGGRYFNLKRTADDEVAAAVGRPAFQFLSAEVGEVPVDEAQISDVYPSLPQPVGERFTLVGKLTADEATITLNYGIGTRRTQRRTYHVARADAAEGSLLRRLWAQTKLAELMIFQKRNEPQIVELGKQHGLVTPFTSLIVLETLEQYVENDIAPPVSLPEMRAEYMKRIDTLEHQQRKQQADKLAAVLQLWQERVKWHQAKFKYPKNFKYKGPAEGAETDDAPADAAPGLMEPREAPAPGRHPAPATPDAEDPSGEAGEDAKKADEGRGGRQPGISIKEWDPKTPYVKALRAARPEAVFDVYLKNRRQYGQSPAFFLDCADHFNRIGQEGLALQVLSNIAEMELENPSLLRVLGHRLSQLGYLDLAVYTFDEVLRLRPEEPQSYRDLALVLARRANEAAEKDNAGRQKDYARAIELLARVVMGHWDGRFTEIELMALEELNAIWPRAREAGVKEVPLDKRLIDLLDVDVRIVMTWHADNTDIDLWVIEPSGEKAFYAHNRTTIGGLVSQDFTGGYGPEEYMVRRAMPGVYKIQANFYGSQATKLLGAVTVQVDVFTDFGREGQQRKSITIRLKEAQETVDIGQIEF